MNTSLKFTPKVARLLVRFAFVLACAMSVSAPAATQDGAKPAAEKWRPKDGTYRSSNTYRGENGDYDRCDDFGDLIVELAEKSISGNEWDCKIAKLTDSAPNAIRLDVSCTDTEKEKPESYAMVLKKIDDKTFMYRLAKHGKFQRPAERMTYCPEDAQRMYIESKARDLAEKQQKRTDDGPEPAKWPPLPSTSQPPSR